MSPRLRAGSTGLFIATVVCLAASCHRSSSDSSVHPHAKKPGADFTASNLLGPRPLDVTFQNTTTGKANAFLWDFGDGTTSTEKNPVHTYTHAGKFTVTMLASGPGGSDLESEADLVRVTAPMEDQSFELQTPGTQPGGAWQSFFGAGGNVGHTIHSAAGGGELGMPSHGQIWCEISSQSTGASGPPTDGGSTALTGAGVSQQFTFPQGAHVLQLDTTFINAEGYAQAQHDDWLSIDVSNGQESRKLHLRDTFSPIGGTSSIHGGQVATPPEVVTGDLETLFPGSDITTLFTLTVQVGNGGDAFQPSHAYVDNIRFEPPGPPLSVAFTVDQPSFQTLLPVQFTDLTTGGATSWSWDFGDGFASSLQNPSHVYQQSGVYDVRLVATAPGSTAEHVETGLVTIFDPSGVLDFHVRARRLKTNQVGAFYNLSTGLFTSWNWTFGDGQGAQQTVLSTVLFHSYATPGLYSVGLDGTFANGTGASLLKQDHVLVQAPPAVLSSPQNVTVNVGQDAVFNVVATGTGIHYEWRRNGWPIQGAPDLPSFTVHPTTQLNQHDFYTCRVFNLVGTQTSTPGFLTLVL